MMGSMLWDQAAAVLKKDLLVAIRYRNGLLYAAAAPALQLATFYYLARAVGPEFKPEGMSYFLFLLIGTGMYTFLLSGMYGFLRIIQEAQQSGTLEVLMTTSTPPGTLLSLSALSAFAGALVQLMVYVGTGLLLFHPTLRVNFVGGGLVFLLSLLTAVATGIFAAGLQVATHKGSFVLWLVGSSAWVVAGTLFPITALPMPVRFFSQMLPLTHSLIAMRLAVVDAGSSSLLTHEIIFLFFFALILLPLSLVFFSWTVQRARQLGTLSFY